MVVTASRLVGLAHISHIHAADACPVIMVVSLPELIPGLAQSKLIIFALTVAFFFALAVLCICARGTCGCVHGCMGMYACPHTCVCACVRARARVCGCVYVCVTNQDDEAVLAGISEEYLEDDGEQSVRVRAAAALRCSERRIYFRTDFVSE